MLLVSKISSYFLSRPRTSEKQRVCPLDYAVYRLCREAQRACPVRVSELVPLTQWAYSLPLPP